MKIDLANSGTICIKCQKDKIMQKDTGYRCEGCNPPKEVWDGYKALAAIDEVLKGE